MAPMQPLHQFVPPPPHPRNVGTSSDWERVERDLRVTYPDDFKEINRRYGIGWFDGFIQVLGPIPLSHGYTLPQFGADIELDLEIIREREPELAGRIGDRRLIPIAWTRNGDEIFYVVDEFGRPREILFIGSRAARFDMFEDPFSEVLGGLLSGRLKTTYFPRTSHRIGPDSKSTGGREHHQPVKPGTGTSRGRLLSPGPFIKG